MNRLLDFLIPRFITDKVVLEKHDDEYVPVFAFEDLDEGETYYATGTVRGFHLFGFVIFPMLDLDSVVIDNYQTPHRLNKLE